MGEGTHVGAPEGIYTSGIYRGNLHGASDYKGIYIGELPEGTCTGHRARVLTWGICLRAIIPCGICLRAHGASARGHLFTRYLPQGTYLMTGNGGHLHE